MAHIQLCKPIISKMTEENNVTRRQRRGTVKEDEKNSWKFFLGLDGEFVLLQRKSKLLSLFYVSRCLQYHELEKKP